MVTVQFEVPEEWVKEANDMDVPMTEFVRRMCNTGRRKFGYDREDETICTLRHDDASPDNDVVKEFVAQNLSVDTGHDQDDLVELIKDDIAVAADKLSEEGTAQYRHSKGGWVRVGNDG